MRRSGTGSYYDDFPVTATLLLVVVGFYVLEVLLQIKLWDPNLPAKGLQLYTDIRSGGITDALGSVGPYRVFEDGQVWRLLAACFLHGGIIHLGMNSLALGDLGRICEPLLGRERFLSTFVIAGITASLASAGYSAITDEWGGSSVGASGAICGLLGVLLGFSVRHRDRELRADMLRSLIYIGLITVLIQGIVHRAHIGGLAAGFVMGLFVPRYTSSAVARRWRIPYYACIAACVVALAFSVIGFFLTLSRNGAG